MKYFVIILILFGFSGSFLFVNQAYALWIPLSAEELVEQSGTIFVGTITDVTPIDVEYQSQIAKNGTMKESIGPEVMTLDEYTINVEEFLKNPQDNDTVTLRQATVGGVPGGPARISGFEVGDRVLFYLPKDEKQTHFPGQYLPESFEIPKICKGQDVLTQKRLEFGGESFWIQNGINVDYGNFTANTPIQFIYNKDMDTLSGKSFDLEVGIFKNVGKHAELVFSQKIHAESKPCEWIAHAEWEFTPQEGDYEMNVAMKQNNTVTDQSFTGFSVKSDAIARKPMSPLQQFKSGIPTNEIQCKTSLVLITKPSDGSPACVTQYTKVKLVRQGWLDPNEIPKPPPADRDEDILKSWKKHPDDFILRVGGNAPCAWMMLEQVPHNYLSQRHDRTGANALTLKISEADLKQIHPLQTMMNAINDESGFTLDEYEKNTLNKSISLSEVEQQRIWDWLKDTFEKQYGKRSDDSFTSYFTYNEKYYHIT